MSPSMDQESPSARLTVAVGSKGRSDVGARQAVAHEKIAWIRLLETDEWNWWCDRRHLDEPFGREGRCNMAARSTDTAH